MRFAPVHKKGNMVSSADEPGLWGMYTKDLLMKARDQQIKPCGEDLVKSTGFEKGTATSLAIISCSAPIKIKYLVE